MALERRTQRSQPRAGAGTARKTMSKTRDRDAALLMATATDRARGRRREEARIGFTRENRTEQSTRTEQGIGMPRAPALCSARAPLLFPAAAREVKLSWCPRVLLVTGSRVVDTSRLMIPGAALQQAAECFGHATRMGEKRGAAGRI